jgi:cobalt/nickel transport system permease protein
MGHGVADRLWLAGYGTSVITITLIHDPMMLAAGLLLALLLAGGDRWRLLRRALAAVLLFNLSVSLGYLLMTWLRGGFAPDYLLLVNLRVLSLVFLGFWLVSHINLAAALSFSPTLSFLVTLAAGQARALSRVVLDFRQAFTSRNPVPPRLRDRAGMAAAQGEFLMERSLARSAEIAQAMRSRGCFDD